MLLIAFISANYVDRSLRKYHVTEHFGLCGEVQPAEGMSWNAAVRKGGPRKDGKESVSILKERLEDVEHLFK